MSTGSQVYVDIDTTKLATVLGLKFMGNFQYFCRRKGSNVRSKGLGLYDMIWYSNLVFPFGTQGANLKGRHHFTELPCIMPLFGTYIL